MNFLAIDVETANPDYSSICQVGIAHFKDRELFDSWKSLINPDQEFNEFNSRIHGIRKRDVQDAPTFKEIYPDLCQKLYGNIVIHHSHFDRVAINRACKENGLASIKTDWLDSCKIVRRTWDQFAYSGYGLSNIALHLGIDFTHHDALEDAVTAGKVVCEACKKEGISIDMWTLKVHRSINVEVTKKEKVKVNPEGHLFGEVVVFTGTLKSYSRKTAKKWRRKLVARLKVVSPER